MDDQWQTNPDQVIVEGWADRDLADGLGLTNRADDAESDWTETDPVMLRLAVYMPDGSALLVQSVWIRDDYGRRGRIEVNPWTGLPSFERITSARTELDESSGDEDPVELQPDPEDPVDDFPPVPPPDDTPAEDDPEDEP